MQIEAVRRILSRCHFDEKKCEGGLEADQRKRIGPLDTAGSGRNRECKSLELRRSRIEPALASRLSQFLINQHVILESFDAERRIHRLEELLEKAGHEANGPASW